MRVIWSVRALMRVEEMAGYIAQDSPSAANRWVEEPFSEVGRLGEFRVFYEVGIDIDVHFVRRASQLIDDEFGGD